MTRILVVEDDVSFSDPLSYLLNKEGYDVAVAETGSLAAAGARLGRSPSAVSMMVKQLQDSLGAPLFTSDRKSQLSPLGRFVLDQAKSEIAHLEATNRAIAKFAATGVGLFVWRLSRRLLARFCPLHSRHLPRISPMCRLICGIWIPARWCGACRMARLTLE